MKNSNQKHTFIFFLFLISGTWGSLMAQPSKYFGTEGATETSVIGLQAGSGIISGDVDFMPFVQGGLYYQYHFKRWLDVRAGINYGLYKGADTDRTGAIGSNQALNGGSLNNPPVNYTNTGFVYQNYQTSVMDISVTGKLNLISLFSPKYKKPFSVYLMGGTGVLTYLAKTDALDASGNIYPYQNITTDNPSEVKSLLSDMRDGKYESFAEYEKNSHLFLSGGLGFRYRLGNHLGLGLESQVKYIQDDLLDGQRWKTDTETSENNDIIFNAGLIFEYLF